MTRLIDRFVNEGWVQETGTAPNGTNVNWTLAYTPDDADGVNVFLNGLKMIKTTDYSITGTTVTFVTAPAVGQTVNFQYTRKL